MNWEMAVAKAQANKRDNNEIEWVDYIASAYSTWKKATLDNGLEVALIPVSGGHYKISTRTGNRPGLEPKAKYDLNTAKLIAGNLQKHLPLNDHRNWCDNSAGMGEGCLTEETHKHNAEAADNLVLKDKSAYGDYEPGERRFF
jgi:hypothetical protein